MNKLSIASLVLAIGFGIGGSYVVAQPAASTPERQERSISSAQAQEIGSIEQDESKFLASIQAAVDTFQSAMNGRKQSIVIKACTEAGWPLPQSATDTGGCRLDVARRMIVAEKPKPVEDPAKGAKK